MSAQEELVATAEGADFRLETFDVTGTHQVSFTGDPNLPADLVARAIAARMALPENVPWSLHDDHGAFLDGDRPIGDQVESGAKVWVSPKTHLG